jgi:FeS assembly SUF system protein
MNQLETSVMKAMRTVYDPEIPVNIYDLGLIYAQTVDEAGVVQIKMTLTAPSCPVAGILPGQVEAKVREVPGVTDVKLELVWDPPWDRDRMSDAAKLELGFDLGFEVVNVTKLTK